MLSSPKHGWATINIGSRSDQCSYLDDVPFLLLDAFLMALQHETPVAIEFDAEGYDYTLVFSTGVIHIISGNEEDSSYRLFTGDVSYKTLAQELISDVRSQQPIKHAGMVKLVDARDLKSRERNLVRVRLPFPAPISFREGEFSC